MSPQDDMSSNDMQALPAGLPAVGVGLKSQHYQNVLDLLPAVDFFEVHAENYMVDGGAHHAFLSAISRHYPLSLHGVGMSLGSADGLDSGHITRFKALVERYRPALVSEHLAWTGVAGTYLNDLLPLPLTEESLAVVSVNVDRLQQAVGRQILVENPSSYLAYTHSTIAEPDFLAALSSRTGCGLILDVNNVYVSAANLGWDALEYLGYFPVEAVREIHLAGHLIRQVDDVHLHIDDHGSAITDDVWALFTAALAHTGPVPTLVEWDTNIPPLDTLVGEAMKARAVLRHHMDEMAVSHDTARKEPANV